MPVSKLGAFNFLLFSDRLTSSFEYGAYPDPEHKSWFDMTSIDGKVYYILKATYCREILLSNILHQIGPTLPNSRVKLGIRLLHSGHGKKFLTGEAMKFKLGIIDRFYKEFVAKARDRFSFTISTPCIAGAPRVAASGWYFAKYRLMTRSIPYMTQVMVEGWTPNSSLEVSFVLGFIGIVLNSKFLLEDMKPENFDRVYNEFLDVWRMYQPVSDQSFVYPRACLICKETKIQIGNAEGRVYSHPLSEVKSRMDAVVYTGMPPARWPWDLATFKNVCNMLGKTNLVKLFKLVDKSSTQFSTVCEDILRRKLPKSALFKNQKEASDKRASYVRGLVKPGVDDTTVFAFQRGVEQSMLALRDLQKMVKFDIRYLAA